ncbi:MAG: hypothetical protein J3T61_07065 [Candidatus Brocadiales bacterium]|nr:hypothetical protein [Candidatus Bathyanammoxibius sp.]
MTRHQQLTGIGIERPQDAERRKNVTLAYGISGTVGSRGLMLSTAMRNRFDSNNVGIVISLGDNPDEILYLGQIT